MLVYQLGRFRSTASSQESYIVSVSSRVAALMRVGLAQRFHAQCPALDSAPRRIAQQRSNAARGQRDVQRSGRREATGSGESMSRATRDRRLQHQRHIRSRQRADDSKSRDKQNQQMSGNHDGL